MENNSDTAKITEIPWVRPKMYAKQEAAIFCKERYGLIEASSKAGKTVGCMAWLLETALISGQEGREYWWVAPVYGQADIAYKRFKLYLPRDSCEFNDTKLRIILPNKAILVFKSAEKPDNIYGDDVWGAVLDEASRMREDSWFAMRTVITATRAPIRIIGNVKGRKNWFYRLSRIAEAGDPNMHYSKIVAADAVKAGVLAQEEIDSARRDLPERVFKELYEAEPSEDEGNPFGIAAIQRCVMPSISADAPYVWGVDLAKSYDWTVAIALTRTGDICRFLRFQKPWNETIDIIRREINRTLATVDATGVGDPILEQLQKDGRSNFEGYKFTASSKQMLMEGLSVAIQQQAIKIPAGIIVSELENFEYTYSLTGGVRYSAPQGLHDDCVCALALAVSALNKPKTSSLFSSDVRF